MQRKEAEKPNGAEVKVLPISAIDVLSDNKWHMAQSEPDCVMRHDNYFPIRLTVFSAPDAPLHAREEIPEEEPTYPVNFIRNQGSWGREGEALSCKGVASIDSKEIPVRLLVWDSGGGTGIFLHSIESPQPKKR